MPRASWLPHRGALLRRWVAASLVVFLHYAPQITSFQHVRNRYFRPWEAVDPLAHAVAILGISLLALALSLVADVPRLRGLRRWRSALFVSALATGVIVNVPHLRHHGWHVPAALCVLVGGLAVHAFARPGSRTVRVAFRSCLFFSTLVILTLAESLTWESWGSVRGPLAPRRPADAGAHPVYFFVFDEWSWPRTTRDGAIRDVFPHLRALGEQAIVFRNAESPSTNTYRSLPMLIYHAEDGEKLPRVFVSHDKHRREWVTPTDEGRPDSARTPSLFRLARRRGYNTALLGFYLPYPRMLGNQVDVCLTWSDYPEPRCFLERVVYQAEENLRFEIDPLSRLLFRPLTERLYAPYWLRMHRALHHDAATVIDSFPRNSLVFVHYPLPHAPYIFGANGAFLGGYRVKWGEARDDDEDRMLGTPLEYGRQLLYLDKVVGGFLDELKRDGRFDDALIVITSDHGWRSDPDTALCRVALRHVPLIVKLPGQRTGHVVDGLFHNVESWHFVEHVIAGRSSDESIERLIARCSDPAEQTSGPGTDRPPAIRPGR
jgi:hypothetical protein